MAALVDSTGGQLVASKYVITAAHCMFYFYPDGTILGPKHPSDIKVSNHLTELYI